MIFRGFRFGMILQLAIGPVCMFIFQTSLSQGVFPAFAGVLGTAVTDGTEILLAIWGVGAVLQRSRAAQAFSRWFGACILFAFGFHTLLGAVGIKLLPSFSLFTGWGSGSVFLQAVLLALSNPLTIVFWAGVFASKIAEENLSGGELKRFGFGCVLSTVSFLSLVAAVGHLTHWMMPEQVIRLLNIAVGLVLIGFGLRHLRRTARKPAAKEAGKTLE